MPPWIFITDELYNVYVYYCVNGILYFNIIKYIGRYYKAYNGTDILIEVYGYVSKYIETFQV
jgi:hypothetical protein